MVTVRVEPCGLDVEVPDGQSIMAAAERQGLFWPTSCHGVAECQTCFFEVVSGDEQLEPPNQLEQTSLRQFAGRAWYRDKLIRLACQTGVRQSTVSGPIVVRKPGVRPAR
jgi:ferredoxin, 2Fe-2S